MDLTQNSAENIEFMVTAIKEKLNVVNAGAIKPEHFNQEMYEDLHDLYPIIEELGALRK
jgi:uncharacterized protein YfkK (UPF0435 family)